MADFVFKRRQRPIRFTWELDKNGCFRSFSKEFAELLGPQDAALIGLPFDAVRKKLKMGKVPAISKAIKKQRSISGAMLMWPACNTDKVVPLVLSAQTVESKSGEYEGLHGFGVIRTVDAKKSSDPVDPLAVLARLRADLLEEHSENTKELQTSEKADPAPELTTEHEQREFLSQGHIAPIDVLPDTSAEPVHEPVEEGITAPGFLRAEPEIPELIIDFNEDDEEKNGEVLDENVHDSSKAADVPENEPSSAQPDEPVTIEEPADTSPAIAETKAPADLPSSSEDGGLQFLKGDIESKPEPDDAEGLLELTDADVVKTSEDPLEVVATVDLPETKALQSNPAQTLSEPESVETEDHISHSTSSSSVIPEATSKDDFERAIANLPDAPKKRVKSGPRSLAELTNSIVRLVDKHPVPRENAGLSKPEQDAFDKIARALGAEREDNQNSTAKTDAEPAQITEEHTALSTAKTNINETNNSTSLKDAKVSDNIIPLPAEPASRDENAQSEPKEDNVTHVVLPRVPPDIEEAAERAREKTGRIPDKPIVAPIDPRLLDRLPIGVAVVRDRDVVYANDTLLELMGYGRFEALNEAGGLEAIFAEPEECPSPSPETVDRVVHVRLAGGGVLSVDARMHAVPWNGTQALMISVLEKIQGANTSTTRTPTPSDNASGSESKHAQQLQARVDQLESVLATATDGVLVIDQRGTIRSTNNSAIALFNADEENLLGASFTTFLAEESHMAALDYLDGLIANGISSVLNDGREVICRTLDGNLFPAFLSMGRVHSPDDPLFCAVLRDITQFKRAEEDLVNARLKAEEANAHKSDYLTKISHEIRTPLNAVIGFSEVMQEERFGELGNMRYKEYTRDIHRSCTHMLTLINDLLDLAKIEAGKVDMAFEAVSAAEIVNECVALLQPQANDQRVIIRASTPLSVPKVVADPKTLRQITLNLLSNAIKFNRSGGQVIVSLVLDPNGEVHLRIRDTGHGMSKTDLKAALQPFRRLDASETTVGSGLGLPLTKALVEANRASFSINSEEDEGTLAEVTFPPQRVLAE